MDKLAQVGNWKGERQKLTQIRGTKNQIVESLSLLPLVPRAPTFLPPPSPQDG